ncbi:MAG TPA: SgcJ/EcaC family oxidoreductase [Phycisphaerae bacterium]|nr:SgcJ/EcaC family oxidoreductase [Phycisphaerae bacterium]
MKRRWTGAVSGLLGLVLALVSATSVRADASPTDERAAIAKTAQGFVDAFQKGDANACASFWAPDGDYIDLDGRVLSGRQAIAEDFANFFAENKAQGGLGLRIEVASIRFPTPDTAIEDGVTSVFRSDGSLPNRAHYTNMLVKKDGQWLLASVRESPYLPPDNYQKLQPLEWAIGEWIEDTNGPHVGRIRFDWSPDRNFMIATRAVGVKDILLDNGSQRIGWDPAAKMLRSWHFESDGGFGEGSWTKDGKNWVIRTSSVLRSGSLMTSTTIVTRVDPDTITWQMKDQQLDGKAIPDSAVVKMKRVK